MWGVGQAFFVVLALFLGWLAGGVAGLFVVTLCWIGGYWALEKFRDWRGY